MASNLSGTVTVDNTPAAAEIFVFRADTKEMIASSMSNAQGEYEVEVIYNGDVYVMAIPDGVSGYRPLVHGPIEVEFAGPFPGAAVELPASNNTVPISNSDTFMLINQGGETIGSNVRFSDPVYFGEMLYVEFKAEINGGYYDNDWTDSYVSFGFFETSNPDSEILTNSNSWNYNNVFRLAHNPKNIHVWIPFGEPLKDGRVYKYGTFSGSFTKETIDVFNGTHTIRIGLGKNDIGTTIFSLRIDDVLMFEGEWSDITTPTTITPVIHYHNYRHPNTYVEISDVSIFHK